jgi:hypothetical protein
VDGTGPIRARVVGRVDGGTLRGLIEDAEAAMIHVMSAGTTVAYGPLLDALPIA